MKYSFTPGVWKLFDDGINIFEAVRESSWWRPRGMDASVKGGPPLRDIHYVRLSVKIASASEWPQVLVLYADGNVRLIPHPPQGKPCVCFGTSVIVGPALMASRPRAEIRTVRYVPGTRKLELTYRSGGSAVLNLTRISRLLAQVQVSVSYSTAVRPFATLRSMFVANGNADVDHAQWRNSVGMLKRSPILTFPGGEASEWRFYRTVSSAHNTSAPDITIRRLCT